MPTVLPQEVAQSNDNLTQEEKEFLEDVLLDNDPIPEGQIRRNPYSGAQIHCESRAAVLCDSINRAYSVYLHMCEAWDKKSGTMTKEQNDVYHEGLKQDEVSIAYKRTIFQKLWPETYKILL